MINYYYRRLSSQVYFCILFVSVLTRITAVEVTRPRGVALSKKAFYDPTKDFRCLDGSAVYPFHYINDDYCDCVDGTDEPGTAACSNGVFHCTNAGHRPLNIPSSRVNDGICDCCDASDEYNGSVRCANNCREMGKKAREEAQKHMELLSKGYQLRLEYSEQGKKKKLEKSQRIIELNKEKEAAEFVKQEKDVAKTIAEDAEKSALEKYKKPDEEQKDQESNPDKDREDAEAAFKDLDKNEDEKLSMDEIKSKWVFDSNKDGIISDEEAKFFLNQKEEMSKEEFLTMGWILMKPHYSLQKLFKPPEAQQEQENIERIPDEEVPIPGDNDDVSSQEKLDEDLGDDEDEDENTEDDSSTEAATTESPYDPETQALVDAAKAARREYEDASSKVSDLSSDIRDLETALNIDFGENDEFAPLYEQCFEYDDREYTYRLCPFGRTTQKQRSGGGDTDLGHWGTWSGPDGNKYSRMKYDKGLSCWNGPARSTDVRLSCGMENKITMVTEPNRCEYQFDFTTPAVCAQPQKEHAAHEEL